MAKKKQSVTVEEILAQALVSEREQPYKLPDNWVWTRFGFLAKDMADGPFGSNLKREHYTEKKEVRIIQLSNIGEDGWRDENKKYTTYEHAKTISRSMVESGNIVIAKMMPAGRAIKVPDEEKAYILSSDVVKFVPKSFLNTDYLLYALNSNDFRNQISSETQGITRARTSIGKMKTYAFPLPPLPEQQRIVTLIESLFEKLDRAKELAQNALDSFKHRKSAILHKAFTGELTRKWREENGVALESWDKKSLSKLCSKITDGEHFRPPIVDSGIPFLSAKDIRDGYISFDNILYVSKETAEKALKRCNPEKGDVLIVSRGATVGRMCVVNTDDVFCLLGSVILLKVENMQSKLVCYFMNSPKISQQLKEISGATAQQAIYLRDIKEIILPVPSYQEQQEIVRILDNLLEDEQKAKELCDVIDKIDHIKKSILARAFRGELGTNNLADESALELLKEALREKV